MIVTFFTKTEHYPDLTIRGEAVRLEIGPILLEIDVDAFKNIMISFLKKASEQGINFTQK